MTDTPTSSREQDLREAEILSRHLHPDYSGGFGAANGETVLSDGEDATSPAQGQESSLKLQGGDVHRDLYRIDARSRRAGLEQRSNTFHYNPEQRADYFGDGEEEQFAHPNDPGAFRRQFLAQKRPGFNRVNTMPVTRNFVEYLDLYGSFAGEDLHESDGESAVESDDEATESRPLLGRRKSTRHDRPGDASNMRTFFTLIKAFIGTGIMFLPKAFLNGGLLFSFVTLVTVSCATMLCFHLLLQCRKHHGGGSYGDLGRIIGGPRLRILILASITISQLGFVCSGIVFTAENLLSFCIAVAKMPSSVPSTNVLIAIQVVVLIPLAFIRNISKLGPSALLADIFIAIGLTYIYHYDISTIIERHGVHPTVRLFNPHDWTLTIGSAIFTFEGIGLILPIQSSMKHPEKFEHLLAAIMLIITVIFAAVGALSYATFGDATKTEIITNFPQTSHLVNAVQFLYSVAVLVGTPVQLFPALRIMENKIFGRESGKRSALTKWKKNLFRTVIVICCGLIAVLGAGDLDKFVALIGSFACVPLVYIYPAFLHYRGIAQTWYIRCGDLLMMFIGIVCMVYTTYITSSIWIKGS